MRSAVDSSSSGLSQIYSYLHEDSQPLSYLILHVSTCTTLFIGMQAIENATYMCRQFDTSIPTVYPGICISWLNWPNNSGWKKAVVMGLSCLGYSTWRPFCSLMKTPVCRLLTSLTLFWWMSPKSPSLSCWCMLHADVCTHAPARLQSSAEREVLMDPNLRKNSASFSLCGTSFCCP